MAWGHAERYPRSLSVRLQVVQMQYCTGRSNQERRSAHNETDTSIIMQKPPDSIPVLVNVQELDWPVPSYYTSQTTQTKRVS